MRNYKVSGKKLIGKNANHPDSFRSMKDIIDEHKAMGFPTRHLNPSHPSDRRHKKVMKKFNTNQSPAGNFESRLYNLMSIRHCEDIDSQYFGHP